ncbi:MAG: TIGR02452 family protein [Synergistaceae bacterium]|nr:TIGR02452 family protein [Synergistaceae bacterium]
MKPSKYELSQAFEDTRNFFSEDKFLSESIKYSVEHTRFYESNFSPENEADSESNKEGLIDVVKARTLKTALDLGKRFPDKKICVLNFAAPTKPGGGVWGGSAAQEESLCRSSTLYPTLNNDSMKEAYYSPNKAHYHFHGWDSCIYSPDVVICKDDDDYIPARLSPEEFLKIDVVTCAAPHIHIRRGESIEDDKLFNIHVKRARNILRIAAYNHVDIFISGAFGCGAFHNDPEIVARAWHEVLNTYRRKFYLTVFAVMSYKSSPNNFDIFNHEFMNEKL